MRLTEHELTVALHGAAKTAASGRRGLIRRTPDPDAWEALGKYQRYQLLSGLADQVLPVLAALPDVETPVGERPRFTDAQGTAAVEEVGTSGVGGRLRRTAEVAARVALVQAAIAHLPPRQDPDALLPPEE